MKKILVTGFEPFNGRDINPSEQIVKALLPPDDTELIRLVLPVDYKKAELLLLNAAERERPDIILSLGQSGRLPAIEVEMLAANIDSSLSGDGKQLLPDSSGFAPVDVPIDVAGKTAYFSSLPVRCIVSAINAADIPAVCSFSAGTYVCNHVMYASCGYAELHENVASGFIHLPLLPGQINEDSKCCSMQFSEMLRGVQTALDIISK
ncbi:MAG: pyroglutamyl-peptidase I [Oscillospiraceae bacterium]|nr:pyroglutamyl-peptidase I [Oscillospiraceae bacterium]